MPLNLRYKLYTVNITLYEPKSHSSTFLPYPLLRYNPCHYYPDLKTYIPQAQIIEPENIYRPAVLIPCPDRSDNIGKKYVGARRRGTNAEKNMTTEYIRFWGIPYKVLDRESYAMTLPSVKGNALFMKEHEINAVYNEHAPAQDEDINDVMDPGYNY